MFLSAFHSDNDGLIEVSPQQASRFAKEIAGDFNPIHNIDAKRFCVPGDLLFSLVLHKYGVSRSMNFQFTGMVGQGVQLEFPETDSVEFGIADNNGKRYLDVQRDGAICQDATVIEILTKAYVAFSGQNFPYVLVPLMESKGVMINTQRPLVIYESMTFKLDQFDFTEAELVLSEAKLDVNGKRGDVQLIFDIQSAGQVIGSGCKSLVLSGLREFDAPAIQALVDDYLSWKAQYRAA